MLSLKTGAGSDTVKTLATVLANTSTHGFDDQIESNDGDDIVTVTVAATWRRWGLAAIR